MKMKNVLQEANGGVFFLDEAYSLAPQTTNSLNAAIDPDGFLPKTPAPASEAKKDRGGPVNALVIVAGYHDKMTVWLSNGNEGLSVVLRAVSNFHATPLVN